MIRDYYRLTKPGIVYSNALTALAGYLFATHSGIGTCLAMLAGLLLTVASACVVNNYLDRDIDGFMERTKERALPNARISNANALVFAAALLLLGSLFLGYLVNMLALAVALAGFAIYVLLYTPLKRLSPHATLVGALSGAVPPVVGYVAATNTLDLNAGLLFLVLMVWQMPHFLAIAIYRLEDYRAAHIPVFPIVHGTRRTQALMLAHIVAFTLASFALFIPTGRPGYAAIVMLIIGIMWFGFGLYGLRAANKGRWARFMFFYSLFALLLLCALLATA